MPTNLAEAREASEGEPSTKAHTRNDIPLTCQLKMPEITVTLPDGSSRRVSAGSTARDVAAVISPGLAAAG